MMTALSGTVCHS